MQLITRKTWNKTHSDFKYTDENGQRWIMCIDERGTYLEPVQIVDEDTAAMLAADRAYDAAQLGATEEK